MWLDDNSFVEEWLFLLKSHYSTIPYSEYFRTVLIQCYVQSKTIEDFISSCQAWTKRKIEDIHKVGGHLLRYNSNWSVSNKTIVCNKIKKCSSKDSSFHIRDVGPKKNSLSAVLGKVKVVWKNIVIYIK